MSGKDHALWFSILYGIIKKINGNMEIIGNTLKGTSVMITLPKMIT